MLKPLTFVVILSASLLTIIGCSKSNSSNNATGSTSGAVVKFTIGGSTYTWSTGLRIAFDSLYNNYNYHLTALGTNTDKLDIYISDPMGQDLKDSTYTNTFVHDNGSATGHYTCMIYITYNGVSIGGANGQNQTMGCTITRIHDGMADGTFSGTLSTNTSGATTQVTNGTFVNVPMAHP
jgi:hypothetical protein